MNAARSSIASGAPALTRVGKYRLIGKLGEGGQAHVYLALVSGPGEFHKLVVVKVLREAAERDPEFLQAFMQEARIAAQVSHPYIVQTNEVGAEGGHHYIAMEYVNGQSLRAVERRLSPERLPVNVHLGILADVARALHHAHTLTRFDGTPLHLVHRDVSPQNVMISYDGAVKLLDFGIVKVGDENRTREGMIKGKVAYMAPEQITGGKVDCRTDVFALGVMIWQAVSGRRFMDPKLSEIGVIQHRIEGKEPRLRDVAPDAPASIVEACDRTLSIDPNKRQASAEELADELTRYLNDTTSGSYPRQLAQLMGRLFADDRKRMAVLIDEQVRLAQSEATDLQVKELFESRGETRTEDASFPSSETARSGVRPPSSILPPALPGQSAPPPRRAALPRWAAPVAAVVGGMASVMAVAALVGRSPEQHVSVVAARPASGAVQEASTTSAVAATPPVPATVRVRIEAVPESAEVELDGVSIGAGHDVFVPADPGDQHVLRVSAAGYEAVTRRVSLGGDLELSIELAGVDSGVPERRVASPLPRPRASTPVHAPPESTAAAEAPRSARQEPAAEAAESEPRPQVLRAQVDSDDPYQ